MSNVNYFIPAGDRMPPSPSFPPPEVSGTQGIRSASVFSTSLDAADGKQVGEGGWLRFSTVSSFNTPCACAEWAPGPFAPPWRVPQLRCLCAAAAQPGLSLCMSPLFPPSCGHPFFPLLAPLCPAILPPSLLCSASIPFSLGPLSIPSGAAAALKIPRGQLPIGR